MTPAPGKEASKRTAQPVSGKQRKSELIHPRTGRDSGRSMESITDWRYAILESDDVEPELWLKILVQLPVPYRAIYSSRGASVHGLVVVNARTKAEWDQKMCAPQLSCGK